MLWYEYGVAASREPTVTHARPSEAAARNDLITRYGWVRVRAVNGSPLWGVEEGQRGPWRATDPNDPLYHTSDTIPVGYIGQRPRWGDRVVGTVLWLAFLGCATLAAGIVWHLVVR